MYYYYYCFYLSVNSLFVYMIVIKLIYYYIVCYILGVGTGFVICLDFNYWLCIIYVI